MTNLIITIISAPRSGTNFILNNLLTKISNLNVNFEIYSDDTAAGVNAVNKKYREEIPTNYSKDEIIDHLLTVSEEKYIVHKIFPFMFQGQEYSSIINRSKYVIFIKRNFLDVFISNKKARQIKRWLFVDTSEMTIYFDIKEYLADKKYYENWFKNTKTLCEVLNKPFVIIDYDIIVAMDSEEDQIQYCIEKLKQVTGGNFYAEMKNEGFYAKPIVKQDIQNDYSKKISNYQEVRYFIKNKENHVIISF
jgi:hypothetical protein